MSTALRPIDVVPQAGILVSSVGKNWRHVRAWRHATPAWDFEVPALIEHTLLFDVSEDVCCDQRFGDAAKITPYRPSEVTLVPASISARFNNFGPAEGSHLDFSPAFINAVAASITEGRTSSVALRCSAGVYDPELTHVARALIKEAKSNDVGNAILADALATQLAVLLLRAYAEFPIRPQLIKGGLSPRQLKRVTDFMEENLSEPIGLTDMAAIADLSPYHFCRAFKATTGRSPQTWLLDRRMELARTLMLREPDMSLIEIALSVGYESHSAFGAAFRRCIGAAPGKWRREATR